MFWGAGQYSFVGYHAPSDLMSSVWVFIVVREHHDQFALVPNIHQPRAIEWTINHVDDGSFRNLDRYVPFLAKRDCHCGAGETETLAVLHGGSFLHSIGLGLHFTFEV